MSAAADHVLVELTIDSLGLARQGFGLMAGLSHTATFPERIRKYSSAAAVNADHPASSPERRFAAAAFAQTPHPRQIAIIRAAGTVTQRYDITIELVSVGTVYGVDVEGQGVTSTEVRYTALVDLDFAAGDVNTGTDVITETAHGMVSGAGPFRLSTTGSLPTGTGIAVDTNVFVIRVSDDTYKLATSKANALAGTAIDITAAGSGTHTLRRAQNDVIVAQLVEGMNAAAGKNFTAVQTVGAGETDTARITADAAGNWFSLAVTNHLAMSIVQSHAAPTGTTLDDDLTAILLADSSWYALVTFYNSEAYVTDVAAWARANGRIYIPDVNDSGPRLDALSGATDIGADLLALGDTRVMGLYYPEPATMLSSAIMGRWLPTDPGKATPKFKTLVGVAGLTDLTDTHKSNLRDRRMNTYEQVLSDSAFFWESTVFSTVNNFLDVTRNSDWLADETTKALLGVFIGNDIVPFSPEGIVMMEGGLRGAGQLAEDQGVLNPGWTVESPLFADISSTDKEERNLRNLKLQGTLRGAIHKAVPVTVVLTF